MFSAVHRGALLGHKLSHAPSPVVYEVVCKQQITPTFNMTSFKLHSVRKAMKAV
jgi:hypothetical protein